MKEELEEDEDINEDEGERWGRQVSGPGNGWDVGSAYTLRLMNIHLYVPRYMGRLENRRRM